MSVGEVFQGVTGCQVLFSGSVLGVTRSFLGRRVLFERQREFCVPGSESACK